MFPILSKKLLIYIHIQITMQLLWENVMNAGEFSVNSPGSNNDNSGYLNLFK